MVVRSLSRLRSPLGDFFERVVWHQATFLFWPGSIEICQSLIADLIQSALGTFHAMKPISSTSEAFGLRLSTRIEG